MVVLISRSKNEKRTGFWDGHRFLLQLQISHRTRSRALGNVRVLLLVVAYETRERRPSSGGIVSFFWTARVANMGHLPGKSAGGKGSLTSLTLNSNSSTFSCDVEKERDDHEATHTHTHTINTTHFFLCVLYLGRSRNAFNTFGPLLSQLLRQVCFLL